jgi:hypothetical protein
MLNRGQVLTYVIFSENLPILQVSQDCQPVSNKIYGALVLYLQALRKYCKKFLKKSIDTTRCSGNIDHRSKDMWFISGVRTAPEKV